MFSIKKLFSIFLLFLSIFFLSLELGRFKIKVSPALDQQPKLDSLPSETPTNQRLTIALVGDVMLGRMVMIESYKRKDPTYPFIKVSNKLKDEDLVFLNLENPILENCPFYESGFKFCALPEMVKGLTLAGVDVVNLANNHSANFGEQGIKETQEILQKEGIEVVGLGNLVIKKVKRLTIGFLGLNKTEIVSPNLSQDEINLINASDRKVDILVVAMHWGREYQDKALPGISNLAKELIKNGADVIVGHHPHWLQDVECFRIVSEDPIDVSNFSAEGFTCPAGTKPVFYSLGNFIFDQMWSEETRRGGLVEIYFDENANFEGNSFLLTYIKDLGQPEFVED